MELDTHLILTLVALHLASWGYNALVGWLERNGYHHGFVSLMVVVGVAYTVLAVSWRIGWEAVMVLVMAFVASGIPMIVGSIARYLQDRRAEQQSLIDHARKMNGG